jgi:hypothetical protein
VRDAVIRTAGDDGIVGKARVVADEFVRELRFNVFHSPPAKLQHAPKALAGDFARLSDGFNFVRRFHHAQLCIRRASR